MLLMDYLGFQSTNGGSTELYWPLSLMERYECLITCYIYIYIYVYKTN